MSSTSPALKAAQAYWDALNSYDLEALKASLAPDAVRTIHPEHIKAPPTNDREAILKVLGPALQIVKDGKVSELPRVVLHLGANGELL